MSDPAVPAERSIPGLPERLKKRLRVVFRLLSAISPALAARLALRLFATPQPRPIGKEEAAFLDAAQTHSVALPSVRLQAYEWAAAGPTVLVAHGWVSHSARLRHTITALHGAGFRVVAFDHPSHGRSGRGDANLYTFRDAIAAVSAALGPVEAIVAHSFGALATTLWMAEQRPAALRAAVLVGMPHDVGYILDSFTHAVALRPDVIRRLREYFLARYGQTPEFYEAGSLAERIQIPVLMVHGEMDEFVPAAHATSVQQRLVRGELSIRPTLKHSAPMSDADSLAAITAFLRTHLSGSGA